MELAYLPKRRTPAEKTYKHYSINSIPVAESDIVKKTEFFYIGANANKIDSMIEAFDGGYAAESTEKAISILKRIAEKSSTTQVDVIVMDGALGRAAVSKIAGFLSSSKAFASVPFVLDASGIQEDELKAFRKAKLVDDIVFVEASAHKIVAKVDFLRKVKSQAIFKNLDKGIQTSFKKVSVNYILKRGFDITVSSLAILALSPLFLLVAAAVRFESRGPIFYIAKRAGRGYRVFNFYKFRTMVVDADKKVDQLAHLNQYNAKDSGPVFFKISNDPRITKVGAFLRNSSLDELPQLFNVLLGDMSLVGNRPLPLYEAASLTTDEWAGRFLAPAGITGLWQIKKRGQEDMSVEERIGLDIAYANKYNFGYDLWIMANTPAALLQKSNV